MTFDQSKTKRIVFAFAVLSVHILMHIYHSILDAGGWSKEAVLLSQLPG